MTKETGEKKSNKATQAEVLMDQLPKHVRTALKIMRNAERAKRLFVSEREPQEYRKIED